LLPDLLLLELGADYGVPFHGLLVSRQYWQPLPKFIRGRRVPLELVFLSDGAVDIAFLEYLLLEPFLVKDREPFLVVPLVSLARSQMDEQLCDFDDGAFKDVQAQRSGNCGND
jgi:hypothetical protein